MSVPKQSAKRPFRPWKAGVKDSAMASREETARRLYDLWNERYEGGEKTPFEDLTLEDIEEEDDLMNLMVDFAVLLMVHPVNEGWYKPVHSKCNQSGCPKRCSVEFVIKLYSNLMDQLQERFPEHPLWKDSSTSKIVWWKKQKTDLREALEKRRKETGTCC